MRRAASSRTATVLLLSVTLVGCDLNFEPATLIDDPRILGIRAEPPEVVFGNDVEFEALVVDGLGNEMPGQEGVQLNWTVCLSLREIVSASGLGFDSGLTDNCDTGGDDLVRLDTEGLPPNAARLPGEAFTSLVAALTAGGGMPPAGGGPDLVESLLGIVTTVGVPLRVRLEVVVDGEVVRTGFKRFAIAMRDDLTTNPPPPRFAVGGVMYTARPIETPGDRDPHVCVPEEGEPVTVTTEAEVDLEPDETEEEWLETYPVVDLAGAILINEETPYYSWFSTGGTFSQGISQPPDRLSVWTTPETPGTYPLIVAVRDGHLGMSWCRTEIEVR